MTTDSDCPFCRKVGELGIEGRATSFPDGYPSAVGHQLVIPARHVGRVEDLDRVEWTSLFDLVREVTVEVSAAPDVDGVNIGINSGEAAGQTVGHVHVHVIPRRAGDVADPRGGVRWVLPETADYWRGRNEDE